MIVYGGVVTGTQNSAEFDRKRHQSRTCEGDVEYFAAERPNLSVKNSRTATSGDEVELRPVDPLLTPMPKHLK